MAQPSAMNALHLWPLKPVELPKHPQLQDQQADNETPDLQIFLTNILTDAHNFITGDRARHSHGEKDQAPASAKVKVQSETRRLTNVPADRSGYAQENWFQRDSVHENEVKAGTASFDEFDQGLRVNHSQHEKEYTPDVQDCHEILRYTDDIQSIGTSIAGWNEVDMYIVEMVHKIPFPLKPRCFTVIVITAKRDNEFIVVQQPVDLSQTKLGKYTHDSSIVHGIYASVERCGINKEGKVHWQMTTASDAKGNLPMFLQKPNMPGAVAKDVGLFITWVQERRKK